MYNYKLFSYKCAVAYRHLMEEGCIMTLLKKLRIHVLVHYYRRGLLLLFELMNI